MNTLTTNELKIMHDNFKDAVGVMERNLVEKLDDHAEVHTQIIGLIEDMKKELKESNGWKNRFMGGLYIVSIVVIPLVGWVLYETVTLEDTIRSVLSTYEFNYEETTSR